VSFVILKHKSLTTTIELEYSDKNMETTGMIWCYTEPSEINLQSFMSLPNSSSILLPPPCVTISPEIPIDTTIVKE
jgi:hypothetical protein